MGEPNLYEILGVPRNATSARIREAYEELSRFYEGSDEVVDTATVEIEIPEDLRPSLHKLAEAYETLSHDDRRATYDSSLRVDKNRGQKPVNYVFGSVGKTSVLDEILERESRFLGHRVPVNGKTFTYLAFLIAGILPFILVGFIASLR